MVAINTTDCTVIGMAGNIEGFLKQPSGCVGMPERAPGDQPPFELARAVLKISEKTYLIVHCYSESGMPSGNVIDDDDLSELVEEGEISFFAEPVKLLPRAIVMIFRPKFKELLPEALPLHNPLEPSLMISEPLELASPVVGAQIFLANKLTADRLRAYWTGLVIDKMRPLIDSEKWEEVTAYARLWFDISERLADTSFAFAELVRSLTLSGKEELVSRYIAMMQRSLGKNFIDYIASVFNAMILTRYLDIKK